MVRMELHTSNVHLALVDLGACIKAGTCKFNPHPESLLVLTLLKMIVSFKIWVALLPKRSRDIGRLQLGQDSQYIYVSRSVWKLL